MDYNLLAAESCKEKKRSTKDVTFLIIFGILILVWINIGIHGFLAGNIPSEIISDIKLWINDNKIVEALSYNNLLLIGFIGFAIFLAALFLIMIAWMTKFMIIMTLCFQLGFLLSFFILSMGFSFCRATQLLFALTIFGIKIYALKKVGMKIVCKVLQDVINAVNHHFPSSFIIVLLEFALGLSVIIFSVTAGAHLLFIKKTTSQTDLEYGKVDGYSKRFPSNEATGNAAKYTFFENIADADPPTYVIYLMSIFICVTISIVCFIGNFRRMLLHGMFTHWYRTLDKQNISNAVSFRYFATIVRHHMGTIAFSSTIFAIVPAIRALFNSRKDLLRLIKNRPSALYALCCALWEMTTNASITCISNGTSLYQSMKDGLQLAMRNPLKYIILRGVTFGLIELGVYFILFINVKTEIQLYDLRTSDQDPDLHSLKQATTIAIGIFSLVISAIYLSIFNNAAEAVILCLFEESNSSKPIDKDGDYLCENNEA
ncbi:CTL-like protein 2 [Nasonia vitripennis]|uniref:Choline transporter-like protein n=1 Tax=Nasonia vitripennis TaxID=7425 RepID=A0A7M7PZJ3_NASVI|nr:CTL-like protein 2 [Nasonia vitripennis]XP_032453578.1 CTL-like protein 2 [Nasonia vitripennis]